MVIITIIVLLSNLILLYLNQMIALFCLTAVGRYSYKSYQSYLINKENLDFLGFIK